MSDNVKLITYMKCQNITMTAYRDVGTILRKHPKNGFFTLLGLCHFCTLMVTQEKTNVRYLRYFKDGLTDGQADEHG